MDSTTDHEKHLIGGLLLYPDFLDQIDIEQDDFSDINCSTTYFTVCQLYQSGENINLMSVNETIKNPQFLSECMSLVSSSETIQYYAKVVKDRSTLRKLNKITLEASVKSATTEYKPEDLINEINRGVSELYQPKTKETLSAKEAGEIVAENIRIKMANPTDVTGMTTGFPSVDRLLNGLHRTDLVILAARPARGKSAFALQIARNVSLYAKTPVMFFSLEMGTEQLVQRLVGSESKVSITALSTGRISEIEKNAVEKALETIGFLPLFFNDKASTKLKDIRKEIKAYNFKHDVPLGLIVVDYLQLMNPSKDHNSMVNQITEISRGLKIIAKEFNVCVIALSQFSREVEKRGGKPRLSDLRDSGSLEQDADVVCFLHSESKELDSYGNRGIELIVEKHRSGSTGSALFNFKGENMTFNETEDLTKF